jgi:DNA-binding FadR family transcriptional regulator
MRLSTVVRRSPAHVAIARSLGVAIVTGQYPACALLPGEIELAAQHDVSRSVIRESLRMLSAKGLIESRPKAGTRIRPRVDWNLLDPQMLGWMFEGAPPLGFVRSLFELRLIVEPSAAEIAAQRRTAAQLSRMGHALELMAQHGLDNEAGRSADQLFHTTILEATENELLVSLSASIAAAVRWTTLFKYSTSNRPRDPMPEHRALFEAIANADTAGARDATTALIRQAQIDTEAALAS